RGVRGRPRPRSGHRGVVQSPPGSFGENQSCPHPTRPGTGAAPALRRVGTPGGGAQERTQDSRLQDTQSVGRERMTPGPAAFLMRHRRELSVAVILSSMLLLLAAFAPHFYEPQPLRARLTAAAPKLVLACGITLVLLARQIDIS